MKGIILRGLARLIDIVILVAIGVAWGWLRDFDLIWLVVHATLVYAYFVVGDAAFGTTPGKLALGLRVTSENGGRPGWGRAAARESFVLLGAIPFAGPILALVAWIVIGITAGRSPDGIGLHDRLTHTRIRSSR